MSEKPEEISDVLSRAFVNNASSSGNPIIQRSQGEMDATEEQIREKTRQLRRANTWYDWTGRGLSFVVGLFVMIVVTSVLAYSYCAAS